MQYSSGETVSRSAAAYRVRKLGSVGAAPRIVAEYHVPEGWRGVRGRRLDPGVATQLLAEGISQVRVRRGLSLVEVSVRRYLVGER